MSTKVTKRGTYLSKSGAKSPDTDNKGKLVSHGFCFCSWYQDKFFMRVKPGLAHLLAIKSCTMTNFWLRCNSYRDTALCPFTNLLQPRQLLCHLAALYRDTRMPQIISTWTVKTRVIPSLHRDSFTAKVPGLCPVL